MPASRESREYFDDQEQMRDRAQSARHSPSGSTASIDSRISNASGVTVHSRTETTTSICSRGVKLPS